MAVWGNCTITCCKDCENRHPGCHGTCEKYLKQKAEHEAQKAEAMKKAGVITGLNEARYNTIHKTTKWRNYRSKYRKGR